ncbi:MULTISPECIES: hypothetical protein, partial [unclassified Chryseobacterium]|uniref:hypothetical protein n=1 Tax=unclassified Chryseobacterium TaxID=2593645 RepID=UPI001E5AD94D
LFCNSKMTIFSQFLAHTLFYYSFFKQALNDLKVNAHKLKVFNFQTLSDAIIYLSKNSPELIKDLPTEKELKTISKVEAELIETEYPKILEKTPDIRFDELQRLEYMKRHNLIRTDEYQSRLMKLGILNSLPK